MRLTFSSPRLWRLFGVSALGACLTGCDVGHIVLAGGSLNATARKTQTGPIPAEIKRIEVDDQCGAVNVAVAEDASYRWTWNLEVHAETDAEARDSLSAPDFRVETNGDTLRLSMKLPNYIGRHRQFISDFELRVPKAIAVQARNHFGPVEITGVDGPVEAHSESGPVTVRNVRENVAAQTSFSSLCVENTGPAKLRDQSGEIVAAQIHGPLDAETSFSSLDAKDIDGELVACNQSGRIEATGVKGKADLKTSFSSLSAEDIHGPLTARNQSGSISARNIGGDCQLETSFSALDASDISGSVRAKNQSGQVSVRKATGAVNAETSFSSMLIEGSGDSFVCQDQSGPITVRAGSINLKRISARTSFSSVDVELPANINASISAQTSFGEVHSDFPVARKTDPDAADIALEDQSGSINIRRIAE